MSAYHFVPGELVRLVGNWGTPSQRRAVWVISPERPGLETIQIHRLADPDCLMRINTDRLVTISPLEALALQA